MQETQVMHPALAARFSAIKTYRGHSLSRPSFLLRADLGPKGFHAMMTAENGQAFFIEPRRSGAPNEYIVFRKNESGTSTPWDCHSTTAHFTEKDFWKENTTRNGSENHLRTYRLALSCTGEYAQYHGGSKLDALTAMTTTINRVNGIFERDLGVRLQLVEENDQLIFLLPHADPFTDGDGAAMLGENQSLCEEVIGLDNFDLGHVFSTHGGGIAVVGSVCNNYNKASGVTGSPYPEGDAFDIDYVAHELAHQFGANHTQNNPCNRNAATSVEPGSGSTILSYAGVCSPNVQLNSDAYFHAISIAEIKNYLSGEGSACAHLSGENHCPAADAGSDFTIPRSTPFVLTGHGSDADPGDILTYSWEQMDNQAAIMPPVPGNSAGPAFRSVPPTLYPQRFFPDLNSVLRGENPTWEVLPSHARQLNFMLTVRDNHTGGGCTAQDHLQLQIEESAGPFRVIWPQASSTWVKGQRQTVAWDVANTDHAPVACSKVDLLLSLDGGLTWDFILSENTPNDGTEEIEVPHFPTAQARVMARSRGNVFFAISEGDFTIIGDDEFAVSLTSADVSCFGENDGSATVLASGGAGGYTFSWSNGAETPTVENLPAGSYTLTVTSGNQQLTRSVEIFQPQKINVKLKGQSATRGSNGQVAATVSGGTGAYSFLWENGSTRPIRNHLPAGEYTVTVTDENGCSASQKINLGGTPPLPLEYGTVENVGESWQIVSLQNEYESMVVVASLELPGKGTASVVPRIKGTHGKQFEMKIQRAGLTDFPLEKIRVHYLVVEEGAYPKEKYGVNFEARRTESRRTSTKGNWLFEAQHFTQKYESPVVVGQVMGHGNHHWSAFWSSRADKRNHAPSASSFSIGKHAGQDSRPTDGPADELGYVVFETGSGYINGKRFLAAVGKDKVRGLADAEFGYAYALSGFEETEVAIVSATGMDDDEGAWPVIADHTPTPTLLHLFSMEDQCRDTERSHASEQVAYLVFGNGNEENADEQTIEGQLVERPDPASYLHAYPNPSRGHVTLEFFQNEHGGPQVIVTDILGREKEQLTLLHSEPGLRRFQVDLGHLERGTYILRILEGKSMKTIKIILA